LDGNVGIADIESPIHFCHSLKDKPLPAMMDRIVPRGNTFPCVAQRAPTGSPALQIRADCAEIQKRR
jgi:hypothetical protein